MTSSPSSSSPSLLVAAALAVVSAAFVAGCGGRIDSNLDGGGSDASPPPPPPSDAQPPPPPPFDGGPPPPWDGGDCNNLPLLGQPVSFNQIPTNAPPFPSNGGSILSGVYVLVAFTNFTGPNGSSTPLGVGQVTVQFSGAKDGYDVQSVALIDNQAPQRSGSIAKITGPDQLTFYGYCPTASGGSAAYYWFNGSSLWLRADNGTGNVIDEQYSLITN
jgi:hypothetical protein